MLKKITNLLFITLFLFSLSGCDPKVDESNIDNWETYSNENLGIIIKFPKKSYESHLLGTDSIKFGEELIETYHIALIHKDSENRINIYSTSNPKILDYLSLQGPLTNTIINEKTYKSFRFEGEIIVYGHILGRNNTFYVFESAGDQYPNEEFDQIMENLKFMDDEKTEETTEEAIDDVNDELTKETTEEATEDVNDELTEETTEEATDLNLSDAKKEASDFAEATEKNEETPDKENKKETEV